MYYMKTLFNFYLIINCCKTLASNNTNILIDSDDSTLNVIQIIQKYGYPLEEHTVTTSDGYILSLYRMPNPKAKESILLVHGLLGSSTDHILLGPKKALGFLLYENGYDVWLLNCRGSKYSQDHTFLKSNGPTQNQYWNFSFHEIGLYDLPSTIEYVLDVTNRSQIVYYGHSQGTTTMFVMLAEIPQYNAKVKAIIAAAPSVFLCHNSNRIMGILKPLIKSGMLNLLRRQIGDFNIANIVPSLITSFLSISCGQYYMKSICLRIMYELIDVTPERIDARMISLFFAHYPDGGSPKQLLHFAQGLISCDFKKFQEDPNINPGEYNLENIKTPIYGIIGQNDTIQNIQDSLNFRNKLKNGFQETIIIENWRHSDFAIARDASNLVFNKVVQILNSI